MQARPYAYSLPGPIVLTESTSPEMHPDAGPDTGVDHGFAEAEERIELPEGVDVPTRTRHRQTPSFRHTSNYLLVGMDRTRGRVWGRSDSVVIAVFDDASGHVGVISVPRDLYVEVPGHGAARINAVMRIATRLRRDPLALLSRVVSDTLAIPIQHVIVADLEAFEHTVDELGGVTIDVRCPIMDNFIDPRAPNGRRLLNVNTGRQRLDGVTAAMYIRSRHGRSDWSRARRQQAVLLGLRDRVRALGVSEWVPVLQRALDTGVTSSMSRLELLSLARRVRAIERDRLHGMLIGHREVEHHRTEEGRAVLVPNFEALDRALAGLFTAPAPGVVPAGRPCPAADAALR